MVNGQWSMGTRNFKFHYAPRAVLTTHHSPLTTHNSPLTLFIGQAKKGHPGINRNGLCSDVLTSYTQRVATLKIIMTGVFTSCYFEPVRRSRK
jgi:hypothetical protein